MNINPYAKGAASGAYEQGAKTAADYAGVSSQLAAIGSLNATNLLVNSNFADGGTGWTGQDAVVDGIAEKTNSGQYQNIQQSIAGHAGYRNHVMYLSAMIFGNTAAVVLSISDGISQTSKQLSAMGVFERLSVTRVVLQSSTGLYFRAQDNSPSGWAKYYMGNAVALDLTAIFGAGNEPTAAQMDAILARYPNSWFGGTVNLAKADKSFQSLVALKNQLDEKTGYGVASGLTVSAQSTPNRTVQVAQGVCYMADGKRYALLPVASLAVNAADATNPRIDIVYVSSAGAVSYLAGTAAASPVAPTLPTGGLLLAEISVAANQTTIAAANITAKKKGLRVDDWITPTLLNGWSSSDTPRTAQYRRDADGVVRFRGSIKGGVSGQAAFVLPAGYRPAVNTAYFSVLNANTNVVYSCRVFSFDGTVVITCVDNTHISLDAISFPTV